MGKFDDMTLEQFEKHWYDLDVAIFGERIAKEYQTKSMNHYLVMKQLWMDYHFKTYGQYAEWEKDHKEERNEYFLKKGIRWEG